MKYHSLLEPRKKTPICVEWNVQARASHLMCINNTFNLHILAQLIQIDTCFPLLIH
jgi:hypothetical protein